MKQKFLEVWRDGQLWYEFPADNEMNVREQMIKNNLDRICEIRPKSEDIKVTKAKVAAKTKAIDMTKHLYDAMTSIEAKLTPTQTPTPEKGTTNDLS